MNISAPASRLKTSQPIGAHGLALKGVGVSHGKAILLGEHSVVYGGPALALPVAQLRVRAEVTPLAEGVGQQRGTMIYSDLYHGTLASAPARLSPTFTALAAALTATGHPEQSITLRISSSVPAERGLGSSAAVAGAVIAAVTDLYGVRLSDDELHELIQTAERAAHGTPSGLDARAVVAENPLWFHHGESSRIPVPIPATFVLADTGVRGRTREAVTAVRLLRDSDPVAIDKLLRRLDSLVAAGRDALLRGNDHDLGEAMTEAHQHLQNLDVSAPSLDALVSAAKRAGALGAKLTGGGRGGCIIALAQDPEHANTLTHALLAAGAAATWTTSEQTQ